MYICSRNYFFIHKYETIMLFVAVYTHTHTYICIYIYTISVPDIHTVLQ